MTKHVFIFFGMIGTGKSYLANAWADRHGCLYLNSDRVRKELAGIGAESRQVVAINEGIYTSDFTRKTYDELIIRTEQALADDRIPCIVLDASYRTMRERERLCECLEKKCRMLFFHCVCPEEIVKKRLDLRAMDPRAVSDGRWEIFLQQKESFALPLERSSDQLVTLDTNSPLADLIRMVEQKLGEVEVTLAPPLSLEEGRNC